MNILFIANYSEKLKVESNVIAKIVKRILLTCDYNDLRCPRLPSSVFRFLTVSSRYSLTQNLPKALISTSSQDARKYNLNLQEDFNCLTAEGRLIIYQNFYI
jgi:hypothetical protein